MASVRDLKKDINNVLGDIIEAVYIVEATGNDVSSKEGNKVIDEAIETFDDLIQKVNDKSVDNRQKHLKNVRQELDKKAEKLAEKVNKLG
ncbi:hypothetical protein [Pareuzebyella sediminis]|uniref:hypothetical protein n=1 Tax=Pareuzebyella sediminis TaxID=2607998 RepID=UPI0011ED9C2C|nr:hypothetical protein [Pareuzebyella sediminis]